MVYHRCYTLLPEQILFKWISDAWIFKHSAISYCLPLMGNACVHAKKAKSRQKVSFKDILSTLELEEREQKLHHYF